MKAATGLSFRIHKSNASALQAEGRRFDPVNSHNNGNLDYSGFPFTFRKSSSPCSIHLSI